MKKIKFLKKEIIVIDKEDLSGELYAMTSPIEKAIERMERALDEMDENPKSARLHICRALGSLAVAKFGVDDLKNEL